MKKAIFNWSGGKDSSLCLHKVLQQKEWEIISLLTSVNSQHQRVSMHGVRVSLLEKQAESLQLPLYQLQIPEMPSMSLYNELMEKTLGEFKNRGVESAVFGDIFLEDLREYREEQLSKIDLKASFPLWKIPTKDLMNEFLDLGFKAVIVCVNEKYLDQSFIGRELDRNFINDLPANVDVCGENGEYHSFVYDGPIFKNPVKFRLGEVVYRNYQPVNTDDKDTCFSNTPATFDTGFWFIDLLED